MVTQDSESLSGVLLNKTERNSFADLAAFNGNMNFSTALRTFLFDATQSYVVRKSHT